MARPTSSAGPRRCRSPASARSTSTSRDRAELEAKLQNLATTLCERLQKADRRGRTIAIKVRLADWTTVTRARTLTRATNEEPVVAGTALELLREYDPAQPVRLLGVRVAALAAQGGDDQLTLL